MTSFAILLTHLGGFGGLPESATHLPVVFFGGGGARRAAR
jgi:hypothetical protein